MPLSTSALGRVALAVLATLAALPATASAQGEGELLQGTFRILPGSCTGGEASGSWFRLAQPNGTVQRGPFFENPDSACSDQTYTLLSPGTDGGLVSGAFQPRPSDPFSATGNSRAGRIIEPVRFGSVLFGLTTQRVDAETRRRVKAPAIRVSGRRLTGNLQALTAEWNDQFFNQGSPKATRARSAKTSRVTGTYDRATQRFTLQWRSEVTRGAFNRFTGIWRLEGRFVPRG
jgi:hypothetical protein